MTAACPARSPGADFGGSAVCHGYRRYALSTIGFFAVCEVALWTLWVAQTDAGAPALGSVAVLGAAHAVVQLLLSRAALRHYLAAGPRPDGLVALYTSVTVVAERLRDTVPGCASMIVTSHARPGALKRALRAGVRGFVPKTVSAQQLAKIIRTVHTGGRYVDQELAADAIAAGGLCSQGRRLTF